MSRPPIRGFVYDNENEAKFAAHGLTASRVDDLLDRESILVKNRRGRRGEYLLIGRDRGTSITVPIRRTSQTGIWRPVTARVSKPGERARLA